MQKRKRLKGFTLVELIVVIALFGLIMSVVVGLIAPVNKAYSRAYSEADMQSISEDLRRFIGNNVQYADRMALYTNMELIEDASATTDNSVQGRVKAFREKYYFVPTTEVKLVGGVNTTLTKERIYPYSKFKNHDEVFVLQIDNASTADLSGQVPVSSQYGTVTLRKFVNGIEDNSSRRQWAVNADYYNDYIFDIKLQTLAEVDVVDSSGATVKENQFVDLDATMVGGNVSPSNLTMGINMLKKDKDKSNLSMANVVNSNLGRTVSFKLKNLVNSTNAISTETIEFSDAANFSNEDIRRFEWYDNTKANSLKISSVTNSENDICIIFTKTPVIEDVIK